jgi:hypothetical protein
VEDAMLKRLAVFILVLTGLLVFSRSASAQSEEPSAMGFRPEKPLEVQLGIRLEQLVNVDQQDEFFTGVAQYQMEWVNPALGFDPQDCQCEFQVFRLDEFRNYVKDQKTTWPEFSIRNQQGNRWSQNQIIVVYPDGRTLYIERFTTNFQVDFDFRKFPFDTQQFIIRIDSLYPEDYYVFSEIPGYSQISETHGEDEFILSEPVVSIFSEPTFRQAQAARFTFTIDAPRHLEYYLLQVFIPILLIVAVSYVTFFLKDYSRRIEVATGNLLLFIAFSFSLTDNYPRLGYMTFLDALMALMFIVNAILVIYNVWLKRLEMTGHGDKAERIDNVLDWLYPAFYIVPLLAIFLWLF